MMRERASVPGKRSFSGPAGRFFRREHGFAAVEFAMLAPIMMMLFIGTVEFSQAITVDRRVTQVASSTADLITREKSVTTTDLDGVMQIINELMQPYDPAKLKVTVLNVYSAADSAANTKVCWSYNYHGGTASYSDGQAYTLPTGILEAGASVLVAEVTYQYDPLIFNYFIQTTLPLDEKFYLKPRLSKGIQYNTTKCL
jgi:Flp pilus assembly protein TadG